MFSQNIFHPTTTDPVENNFIDATQSDPKASTLFTPSGDGRLFRTVQDSTQVLPPHIKKLESGTVDPTSSNLLPLEGRITKAAQDNALPIFFAGARPTVSQPEEERIILTEKRPSLLSEVIPQQQDEPKSELLNQDPTDSKDPRTIKIFGFPTGLTNMILSHFEKYGRIEQSRSTPGSWLIIRYINPSSAAAALKSNGIVLADNFMIGVTMATDIDPIPSKQSPNPFISIVPTDADHIVPLGSGKSGISVMGLNTINPTGPARIPETTGWIGFIKDALFAW